MSTRSKEAGAITAQRNRRMAERTSPTFGEVRAMLARCAEALLNNRISKRSADTVIGLGSDMNKLSRLLTRHLEKVGKEPELSGQVPGVSDLLPLLQGGEDTLIHVKAKRKRARMAEILKDIRAKIDADTRR